MQKETESLHIATAGLEQQLAFIRENTARIQKKNLVKFKRRTGKSGAVIQDACITGDM